MGIPEPTVDHLNVLRKYFGHNHFRPMQWKIIYSIIEERRDNCVIMATGYGKSLCYQYPAVYRNELSIVISPLISLMQDQVFSLNMSNIPACYLGSAQLSKSKTMDDVYSGKCRILYVSPEWCTSEIGQKILNEIKSLRKITLIAIDEAHCVSQWGHDFRHAFRHLNVLHEIFDDVPILAVTATATPQVRVDIVKTLRLRNALITCTSFDRPNLYFSVWLKSGKMDDIFRDFQKILVKSGLGYKFPGPTIIYCPTKKKTEEIANILIENGIICAPYHSALGLKKRQEVHEKFIKDELSVVVATVAFGMGIDKPDVRCVVHYGAPKEIESYYQEVGRAGRDGLPAACYVFYSSGDFVTNSYFIENSVNQKHKEHQKNLAKRLMQYLETQKCRRELLLSYFDNSVIDRPKIPAPNCCDNCTKALKSKNQEFHSIDLDLTDDVILLLKAIDLFNGRFGMTIPIKFLRGTHDNKIPEVKKNHELFGSGKDISEAAWKALGRLCLRDGLMEEKSCSGRFKAGKFPMSTIQLTQNGKKFIWTSGKCNDIVLVPTKEVEIFFRSRKKKLKIISHKLDKNECNYWNDRLEQYKDAKVTQKEKEQQSALYSVLKKLRDSLALRYQVPPVIVANDTMCYNMAVSAPSNITKLAEIDGFNEARLEKYGRSFIEKIEEFYGKKNKDSGSEAVEDSSSKNNDVFPEILTAQFLNENAFDYGKAPCLEYELNKDELNEFNNELTIDDDVTLMKTENIWGEESDEEIFQNLPLEELENFSPSSNATQMHETNNKYQKDFANKSEITSHITRDADVAGKSVLDSFQKELTPEKINDFDTFYLKPKRKFMYDDADDDDDTPVENTNKNKEPSSPQIDSNTRAPIQKRTLPTWLTQPESKMEIKRRIKNNSLFKF